MTILNLSKLSFQGLVSKLKKRLEPVLEIQNFKYLEKDRFSLKKSSELTLILSSNSKIT